MVRNTQDSLIQNQLLSIDQLEIATGTTLDQVELESIAQLQRTPTNQEKVEVELPHLDQSSSLSISSLPQIDQNQEIGSPLVSLKTRSIKEEAKSSENRLEVPPHLSSSTTSNLTPSYSGSRFESSNLSFNSSQNSLLTNLSTYTPSPSFLHSHLPNACSSCGILPLASSSVFNQTFIILPCNHFLCPVCLNTLINSTANDPPRKPNCFACPSSAEDEILDFKVVRFDFSSLSSSSLPSEDNQEMKVQTKEVEERFEWKTPTKSTSFKKSKVERKLNLGRLETILLGELSPARNFLWNDEPLSSGGSGGGSSRNTTPGTTPESNRSYNLTVDLKGENEIASPQNWNVVRVDNIPWDLEVRSVQAWLESSSIPQIPKTVQILSIHILCNRGDGRTLNQLFIELPSLAAAQKLVRAKNAKKIVGRTVSVVLTSQEELMRHVFPAWTPGFDKTDALSPAFEGELISVDDLEGLMELCEIGIGEKDGSKNRATERAFLQIATILTKFPFHQPEVYTVKLVARLFMTVQATLTFLLDNESTFDSTEAFENVVEIVLKSALACPVFRASQKSKLLLLVGLSSLDVEEIREPIAVVIPSTTVISTPPASPSYPKSHLRSPTLDRVKNTFDSPPLISPLKYNAKQIRSPSGSKREWIEARPVREPVSPGTRKGIEAKSWRSLDEGNEGGDDKIKKVSDEMGVDIEFVKKILELSGK